MRVREGGESVFVDQVEITVEAGSGGKGAATFRREKFVPRGGPSGGDGGKGGSIIFVVDPNLSTLLDFHYNRQFRAGNGEAGQAKKRDGRDGDDVVVRVPPGTLVTDVETGDTIADLVVPGERAIIARGGAGGRGNVHFTSSVRQAPHFAELGEPGERRRVRLDLKLVADVGIVGFPSVGKSTFIAAVSAARPKIADYPFTTLVPHLGLVSIGPSQSFVLADMPGLIEGAHAGSGLGDRFLRHIERTRVLIHMLDVSGLTDRDPLADFYAVNRELALHSAELAARPQIVALNKMDICGDLGLADRVEAALRRDGWEVYRVSAATHFGVPELLHAAWRRIEEAKQDQALRDAHGAGGVADMTDADSRGHVVIKGPISAHRDWQIERDVDGSWLVSGGALERLVQRSDLDNEEAISRLQHILEGRGVHRKLRELGAVHGDTVRIGESEFVFHDEDLEDESRRHGKRKGEPAP
jgi:GTP-binding protein